MQERYDVAIAGGGPAGASLALALARTSYRVALIEPVAPGTDLPSTFDDRGLALSVATVRVLCALGVWEAVGQSASPIRRVHVSEQGRFGCVRLEAGVLGLDTLGYTVIARDLGHCLLEKIATCANIDLLCPAGVVSIEPGPEEVRLEINGSGAVRTLHCRLLVAADGSRSRLREGVGIRANIFDYGQAAIVANVTPCLHHGDTAFERFAPEGPAAILPLAGGRCVSILCGSRDSADARLAMVEAEYLELLHHRSGRRLGGFTRLGRRSAYPLLQVVPGRPYRGRVVLLGNAAHTLHPNAAQGFNLAIRDVAGLAEHLQDAGESDPGAETLLAAYATSRRRDQQQIAGFTHGLAQVFYSEAWGRALLRNTGMLILERGGCMKREMARTLAGLRGRQPAWVRGAARP